MLRLSSRQLRTFSAALGELYASPSLATLGTDIVRIFKKLIPAAFVCVTYFDEIKRTELVVSEESFPGKVAWDLPPEDSDQTSFPRRAGPDGATSPPRLSDASDSWSDHGSRQLVVMNPADHTLTMFLYRKLGDFTAWERHLAYLLVPHVRQVYRLATFQAQKEYSIALGELAAHRGATLVVSSEGKILFGTKSARDLCRQYHWIVEGGRLGSNLGEWLAVSPAPGAKFMTSNGPLTLVVEFLEKTPSAAVVSDFPDQLGGDGISFLRLVEKPFIPNHRPLRQLGLTLREAEVLLWITEGKSNTEIGIILAVSPNTVRKHVEHVLRKLDVENRGAAAALAREFLG